MKKKLGWGGANQGERVQNQSQNFFFFFHFLKFGSVVFLKIAYNDSLQQCITFCRCKTSKKVFGRAGKIWAKIGLETRFLTIFSSLPLWLSLKLHTMIPCKNVQHQIEVKFWKKNFRDQIWNSKNQAKTGQNQTQN